MSNEIDSLGHVTRSLLDCLNCVEDLISGSSDGFKLDVICDELGKVNTTALFASAVLGCISTQF